jgi:hypothetical protein
VRATPVTAWPSLDVERDDRLVFDDQHVGRHLVGDFPAGLFDQRVHRLRRSAEDRRDLARREPLHRAQQKRLARQRRDRAEIALVRRQGRRRGPRRIGVGGAPELQKYVVERLPMRQFAGKRGRIGDQRLEGRRDMGVAARLRAAEKPGEAAQRRQLRRDLSGNRHSVVSLPNARKATGEGLICKRFIFCSRGNLRVPSGL